LTFVWSADGTATVATVASTSAVPFTDGQTGWIRVTLDVDNGSAGNTATFYTSTDGTTWTQLDSPIVTAGVTSIFNNASVPYSVGSYHTTPTDPFFGDIFWVEVCIGLAGWSVIPPMLTYYEQTTTTTTPTVVFNGAPSLLLLCASQSGQNILYLNDSVRRPKLFAPHGQQLVMLSTGNNEGNVTAQSWFSSYSSWVTNVKTNVPNTPIVVLTQNPTLSPITAGQVGMRARRGAHIMSYAATTAGVYGIDTYPAFTDIITQVNQSDGVHPTAAGSEVWADLLHRTLFM
jgi:hypothetical protein